MRTPFSLSGPVSLDRAGRNSLSDTLKIKTALEQSGFYKPDDDIYTPGEDTQFWDGLAAFQDANGLKVDRIAKPAGPTVQALNAALAKSPPKPILGAEVGPASPDRRIRNEALIRADANSGDPGDLAPMLAATLRSKDGAQAAPEVADYIRQTFASDPEKGKRLHSQMAQLLHPDDADKISKASGIARANQTRQKATPDQSEPQIEKDSEGVEWRQEPTMFPKDGTVKIRTSGQLRLGANSQTTGLHGLRVMMTWHPLDKDGNVQSTWERPESERRKNPNPYDEAGFTTLLPGVQTNKTVSPPWDNPYGWEVRVIVPPQNTNHGNAGAQHLNIYVPKDSPSNTDTGK